MVRKWGLIRAFDDYKAVTLALMCTKIARRLGLISNALLIERDTLTKRLYGTCTCCTCFLLKRFVWTTRSSSALVRRNHASSVTSSAACCAYIGISFAPAVPVPVVASAATGLHSPTCR